MNHRHVAIFGAGIAGLSAAHELIRRGYTVSVYESEAEAGGFFRSARLARAGNLPTEYSWHGLGPWYHNAFDVMRQIPFDNSGSVYARALSRPIDFGIFPDDTHARFYRGIRTIPQMFRFSWPEAARWAWLMFKTWTANRRTEEIYSRINAAMAWKPLLRPKAYTTWRACFGPWIGSDWTKASLHHTGQFFRKQLITRPSHDHPADEDGPAWRHGARDGWLLLRGPSSEVWFDHWVRDLKQRGVTFVWREGLHQLEFEGQRISSARLASGQEVTADDYILAINPFAAASILARTPALEALEQLSRFKPLVQDGPHVQVSFRIGFAEGILFPIDRTAVVVADSEFNLTLFAEEQVWRPEVPLGRNIKSLWTGTSCVGTVPGRLFHLPVIRCTKEQFIAEIKAQIWSCGALDRLIREANAGRGLADFRVCEIEVWHEWQFSPDGIRGPQPKWVTTMNTQPYLPEQITPVKNLFLAGSHTRTEADVWSIEGAVESGRRAARGIDPAIPVISQYRPRLFRLIAAADDLCYACGLPHILTLVARTLVVAVVLLLLIAFAAFMKTVP